MPADVENSGREAGELSLCMAGAAAGAALGVFVIALLALVERHLPWYIRAYEPIPAFFAALGVAAFAPRRAVREGVIGMAAALVAMLMSDVSLIMGDTLFFKDLVFIPARLFDMFWWSGWPKLVRYGFGMYLAWYLCAGGRGADPDSTVRGAIDEPL